MEKRRLYMDYFVIIFIKKEVLDVMMLYLIDYFGNVFSFYIFGREVKDVLDKVRE